MGDATAVRASVPDDLPAIFGLVRELAEYENESHEVEATEEHLRAALFPVNPKEAHLHALVAEQFTAEGSRVVGMAFWYLTYSTYKGRHGIWLTDLFVQPAARGQGLGTALLTELARIGAEREYCRIEWGVLDWNTTAGEFYRSLGARPLEGAAIWRLDGQAMSQFGRSG